MPSVNSIKVFLLAFVISFCAKADYLMLNENTLLFKNAANSSSVLAELPAFTTHRALHKGKSVKGFIKVRTNQGIEGWVYKRHSVLTKYPTHELYLNDESCKHILFEQPVKSSKQLCRLGYAVGYNLEYKIADWVSYFVRKEYFIDRQFNVRKKYFVDYTTNDTAQRAVPRDFKGLGYDMAQLANSMIIRNSDLHHDQTYLLSNVVPLRPHFSRYNSEFKGVWGAIEEATKCWLINDNHKSIYVIAGTIFPKNFSKLDSSIVIPTGLWKVIVNVDTMQSISFLFLDQEKSVNDSVNLSNYLSTIDEIEFSANVDVLSNLPNKLEDIVERRKGSFSDWPLFDFDRSTNKCSPRVIND